MTPRNPTPRNAPLRTETSIGRPFAALAARVLGFIAAAALHQSVMAQQTVGLTANPTRFTLPVSDEGVRTNTVAIAIGGGSDAVNLAVTGLPAGVTASFDLASFTASGTAVLSLAYTNVAAGYYDVAVEATGGAARRLPMPVIVGTTWRGGGSATLFSEATNWFGGAVPGPDSIAVFGDTGALPDDAGTNVVVNANTTVAALRFTQGTTRNHNLSIESGATLAVAGSLGFTQLRDELPSSTRSYVNIYGDGTLVVTNPAAPFSLLVDNQQESHLYLDQLNTLVVEVERVALGDYLAYPDYGTNGNATHPRRFRPRVRLARTNVISAGLVDPNGYNDPTNRLYAFMMGRNERAGTSASVDLWLGHRNAFSMDALCFIGSGAQGTVSFFATNNEPSATFQGLNGQRMSVFAVSDGAGPNALSSNTKATINLAGGTVSGFIDRFYLGRDRTLSAGYNTEAFMNFSAGTIDVNHAILGYQQQGNHTAANYCRGRLGVDGSAVFVVNGLLELGHTTAAVGDPTQPELGFGQLNIGGGTVRANAISVGGVTKASADNRIALTAGGTLVVSNRVGAADAKLTALSMSDSTLVLHVNGAQTDPYVFTTTLTTGGNSNRVVLSSVTGVTEYPAALTLISYQGAAAPNFSLGLPAGLYGYIVNNTAAGTVDAIITTNPPAALVWNGNLSAIWDKATANWKDGKIFGDGDAVVFDDSASGGTTVNVSGTVTPGGNGVLVTNATKAYTLAGGTIAGTGVMTKQGAASLTINATSEVPLTIEEGWVDGSGSIGFTTVGAGTSLSYAGSINGLSSSGSASSSGTVNIGTAITGGSFHNSGTLNGTLSTAAAAVTNAAAGIINAQGVSSVGGLFAHFGQINNLTARLDLGGFFFGTGKVSDLTGDFAGNNGRFAINNGATLSPGAAPSNSIGSLAIEARLDLNPGGNLLIEIDLDHPATNDFVLVDKLSNYRGNLLIQNIGAKPFAVGQSFHIVRQSFGLPNTPEATQDFSVLPAKPGVGLAWDTSQLTTNGILSIVQGVLESPTITNSVSGGNLTITWPQAYLGWKLLTQTNAVESGVSTNAGDWDFVPGSENASQAVLPIPANQPGGYFRLVSP